MNIRYNTVRAVLLIVGVGVLLSAMLFPLDDTAFLIAGGILLPATSGWVLQTVLSNLLEDDPKQSLDQNQRDTGRLIGKCENVLVYMFVVLGAYTALGLVFAAKSLVRKEDIDSDDTSYYLTGTLVNFTYSIAVALFFEALPTWL